MNSQFLLRNHGCQKAVMRYILSADRKKNQVFFFGGANMFFEKEGDIKTFPDK